MEMASTNTLKEQQRLWRSCACKTDLVLALQKAKVVLVVKNPPAKIVTYQCCFLNLYTVLGLCKRMSLFLKGKNKVIRVRG